MIDRETTSALLQEAARIAVAGGNPQDSFKAFGLDIDGVADWVQVHVEYMLQKLAQAADGEVVELEMDDVVGLMCISMLKGIAIGVQTDRLNEEEIV